MICKECGKEIPEGASYCEACGAPVSEPVVLKISKDDIKRAEKEEKARAKEKAKAAALKARTQPVQRQTVANVRRKPADPKKRVDIVGYFQAVGSDFSMLMAFAGAILLYLSPFMNWIWERIYDTKRKANLFEIGLKSSMVEEDGSILAMGATIVLVLAIVALLVGVWMLLLSASDYIRGLRRFSANPVMRLVPIAVIILIFVIVFTNRSYTQALDALQDDIRLAKDLGSSENYDGGRGLGPVFYIAGLVLYTLGTLSDLAGRRHSEGGKPVTVAEKTSDTISETAEQITESASGMADEKLTETPTHTSEEE